MSVIDDARRRVADTLGSTLARKASDAFVLRHGRERRDGVRSPRRHGSAATILEYAREPVEHIVRPVAPETYAGTWRALTDFLRESGDRDPELSAIAMLRRHAIVRARDGFQRDATPAIDALGGREATRRSARHAAEPSRPDQTAPIESCWLSRSIKTWSDLRAVANVADDRGIQRVDLPHTLACEIGITTGIVGAAAYRAKYHVDGQGVIVAIVDSEIAVDHPSLVGRVVQKANFTHEPWGNPDTHGTAVAGIVGNASRDLTGIAPAITFYNYKVFATLTPAAADDFQGALAIERAVEDGAHIANCSWGVPDAATDGQSQAALACDKAWALGLVVVTSSGNAKRLTAPADADGVIAAGASNRRGTDVPAYSACGPTLHGRARPHLVAPGGTLEDPVTSCVLTGGFSPCGYGTSYAAAHVSGLVALLLSRHPTWTPDRVRDELLAVCHPLQNVDGCRQGRGLLRLL